MTQTYWKDELKIIIQSRVFKKVEQAKELFTKNQETMKKRQRNFRAYERYMKGR